MRTQMALVMQGGLFFGLALSACSSTAPPPRVVAQVAPTPAPASTVVLFRPITLVSATGNKDWEVAKMSHSSKLVWDHGQLISEMDPVVMRPRREEVAMAFATPPAQRR
jgi:hypothetical protein